jgi:hypothetical protein
MFSLSCSDSNWIRPFSLSLKRFSFLHLLVPGLSKSSLRIFSMVSWLEGSKKAFYSNYNSKLAPVTHLHQVSPRILPKCYYSFARTHCFSSPSISPFNPYCWNCFAQFCFASWSLPSMVPLVIVQHCRHLSLRRGIRKECGRKVLRECTTGRFGFMRVVYQCKWISWAGRLKGYFFSFRSFCKSFNVSCQSHPKYRCA